MYHDGNEKAEDGLRLVLVGEYLVSEIRSVMMISYPEHSTWARYRRSKRIREKKEKENSK